MFTDNCIIFCKANRTKTRRVKAILKNYYNISRQLINYHKDGSIFERTENWQKHVIVDSFEVPTLHSIGTYLKCKLLIEKET